MITNDIHEPPGLTPTQIDLLTLLRNALAGRVPDTPPADWPAVLELAWLQQVDLFLYPSVSSWPLGCQPPEELMTRWRGAFFGAAGRYAQASIQLKELLNALHEAQVRIIPLKGAWLAETLYEDGACRPMCDFDLLVPLEELDRARAVFEGLGYATPDHYMSVARNKDIHYLHPEHPMTIELHWRVWHEGKTNVVEPSVDRLWTGLHEEQLHGIPILAFPPERQVAYLAQHILHHSMTLALRAYLDLILLSRRYSFDPALLESEAQALGVPFGAKFILQIAMDIGGRQPPESLASFMPAEGVHATERKAAFLAVLQLSEGSSLIKPEMVACRKSSWVSRLMIGLEVVFKPPGFIRSAYPQAVHRLGLMGGYSARLADLIRRSKPVWHKFRKKDSTLDTDFENFNTRQALSEWMHEKNRR